MNRLYEISKDLNVILGGQSEASIQNLTLLLCIIKSKNSLDNIEIQLLTLKREIELS